MNYVFDVDGTLTPPRGRMDKEFRKFFTEWMDGKDVYILTGSDKNKTIEQIGDEIWKNARRVYQCCGNEVWCAGQLLRKSSWRPTHGQLALLFDIVNNSKYPDRCGNHVEIRTGMVNVSTVGRNTNDEERRQYAEWDAVHREREHWCMVIERCYRYELQATAGGQISIDVYPIGKDKSQILDDLYGDVSFFGDKCMKGGNDFAIASKMRGMIGKTVHQVKGPEHTRKLLEML